MIHILKIIAVLVAITYSLKLINSESDLLVFSGLGVIGLSVYYITNELFKVISQLKSKL